MMPDAQNIVIFQTDIKVSQGKMRSCKFIIMSMVEGKRRLGRGGGRGGEESGREWTGTGNFIHRYIEVEAGTSLSDRN